MALAPLGFVVDTSGVAKAVAELGDMTVATDKAEKAAKSLSVNVNLAVNVINKITAATREAASANDNAAGALNRQAAAIAKLTAAERSNTASHYAQRAEDIAAYGAELDRLRAKFNPIFAASKAYENELNELNRAHKIGAISTAEHGAALVALNGRYQAAATGAQAMGQSTAMAQMQMRNLAFQFQDIGTMLMAGQSPFMLLAQQLPQVTMYGGRLTGVMAALKQTMAGLFSPLGLLTTGFVLAGSAAISYFTSASDEADAAADALDEHLGAIERVADRWGDAVPALRRYADELRHSADMADLAGRTKEAIDAQFDAARVGLSDVRAAVGEVIQDLIRAGDTSGAINDVRDAFNEADRAVQDLQATLKDNKATTEDFDRVSRAMADVLGIDVVRASELASEAIRNYRDDLADATREAGLLAGQQALIDSRGGIGLSGFGGGRGSDPRDIEKDEYWRNRYFPDPERAARQPRTRRSGSRSRLEERDPYAEMIRQSQQFIAVQRLEQQALFMTEEAANALRYEQELLNQAANDNIKLTPEMKRELHGLAQQMASTEAETTRLQEALKFGKDLVRGFVSDLRSGLEQGKGFWRSFADAALNALNKVVDKLLTDVIDAIFQVNRAGAGGGSGGGLMGFISGLFGIGRGGFGLNYFPPAPSMPVGLYHSGGIVGQSATMRMVDPSLFINATRYHSGGVAGIKPDEVPAILQRGEIVLPKRVSGGAPAGGDNITVPVNVSIDATGADPAGLARVEREVAGLKQSLPGLVIDTFRNAQKRRMI